MRSVFDKTTRNVLRIRINTLQKDSPAQWGKMSVSKMVKHCSQWDEMAQGKTIYKQSFLGKLVGKMALKSMMKDEPMKKNLPTVPSFVIREEPDFQIEKNKWLHLLDEYESFSNKDFIHPFFGRMTEEQIGQMAYKHADHHLRQFGS